MGLLATNALLAAVANAPVRQVWTILVPESAGSTTKGSNILADDSDPTLSRVLDPGTREVYAFNVSRMTPGKFEIGEYTIVADNTDGKLNPLTTTSLFTHAVSGYQAVPQECDLKHEVYLWVSRAWSLVLTYIGRIKEPVYEDTASQGVAVPGTLTLTSYSKVLSDVLEHVWGDDDGDEIDADYTFAY